MTDKKTSDLAEPHVMHTYGRLPIALSHGKGVWVWDTTGKKYIDGLSGIAVSTLGHEHPKLVAALHDQVSKIIHTSNYYASPLQERVAAKLCELSGLSKAFFCNSGLEANEAAIKIARKYGHGKGIEKPEIIVYEKAFHGRSIATLAATGNVKVQVGFGPLPEGFPRVPLNDFEAVKAVIESNPNVCAVFLEVIQGEGGVNETTLDYLKKLRALCDERDVLLMLDEVQCGLGRTGKWFAHQWAGIKPDVMPLAKGLASGVPVGAVVVGEKLKDIFSPGNHGTTFGGNPLAMRAAITTLETIEQDKLLENAAAVGEHFRAIFKREFEGLPGVLELRGEGLMIGIALDRPCGELLAQAAEKGVLLSVTADTVVRLLPALIMTKEEATHITDIIVPMIKDFLAKPAAKSAA